MGIDVYAAEAKGIWGRLKRRQALIEQLRNTPQLRAISGPCKGDEIFVDHVPFRVGKGKNNQFVLNDPGVAGLHAMVSKNGLGVYSIVASNPTEFPIFYRRWGRYRSSGHIRLKDKMILRLGRQGPRVRFRYLGERDAKPGTMAVLLGARPQSDLLPETQVQTRLDQMFTSGRLGEQERHYVNQASQHLERLHKYRRWFLMGSVALLLLGGALIYWQVMLGQKRLELTKARDQLNQRWLVSQAVAGEPVKGPEVRDDNSDMLLANDRTARGMLNVMKGFGIENPHVNLTLVNLTKQEVDKEVERLLRDTDLEGFLDRYRKFHPRIEEVFQKEYQLPKALAYVAWIESEYYLDAESDKGALGMWQFTIPAATQYGLITDKGEDFRMDFEASTRAAGAFLSDLMGQFGMDNFMIGLVAYNYGPEAVLRTYRRNRLWRESQRTLSFLLTLKERSGGSALPEETQRYVPRFFAVNLIGSDMSFYLGR